MGARALRVLSKWEKDIMFSASSLLSVSMIEENHVFLAIDYIELYNWML